ncbi:energy transducer TonB [Paremcibacter congregatus]|jgi:protein TonB|uniref:energy transducer TonB n=1 Tax=Paremcibacter congregatus TaxID=2043170 RepID=UPI0030EEAB66|tara:strand:+ start:1004 stop:1612 length:609 start_codon:yes stop_codon:yes gene_type:complete
MIARYSLATIFAILITFSLFWGMQYLIALDSNAKKEKIEGQKVEIGEVRQAQEIEQKIRKPDKPEEADTPPETPEMDMDTNIDNVNTGIEIGMAPVTAEVSVSGGGGFAASDGDYLPIVKVAPVYPRRAQERGLSGYVIVEFTVTKLGTVVDAKVVESTNSVFDRNAIKAALKFKYKPKVVDGVPIDVAGVLHKITFEMAED